MRIKRFEAPDTTTALAMVKQEMGDDAVILATRTIAAGRGSIVKKGQETKVEVVAAMDYDLEALSEAGALPRAEKAAPQQPPQQPPRREPPPEPEPLPVPAPPSALTGPGAIAVAGTDELPAIDRSTSHLEAHDLRRRFAGMLRQQHAVGSTPIRQPATPTIRRPTPPPAAKPAPDEVAQWRDQLIGQLAVARLPETPATNGPAIIALVGATGVGKTTTAAKLAAWFSLHHGLKVALFSMDCYRIGATDQLRTYAKIMRLPCEIVLRKQDLTRAIAAHADRDVIIIDTAGKSPYDETHVKELQEWFAANKAIAPYLVLSATTKKEDLANTVTSYRALAINGLMLTKIDETRTYATLCQQVVASQLPVASVCTGQRVPEDFMVADLPFLAKLFRRGWEAVVEERISGSGCNDWTVQPHREAP